MESKTERRRIGYYSPPSDSWHRTQQAAYNAARKALRGTGQAASIFYTSRDGTRVFSCSVSDQ
jgi:hypothetical protein